MHSLPLGKHNPRIAAVRKAIRTDALTADGLLAVEGPKLLDEAVRSNLEVLENYYAQLIGKYPNSAKTIWVERLLTRLLESNLKEAKDISNARIVEGDEGGFNFAGRSFYQLANEYIQTFKYT